METVFFLNATFAPLIGSPASLTVKVTFFFVFLVSTVRPGSTWVCHVASESGVVNDANTSSESDVAAPCNFQTVSVSGASSNATIAPSSDASSSVRSA